MRPQPEPIGTLLFGPFEYDERSGQLRKHGSVMRLQGKPLQILSVLVSRPGQVITRDELQQHLWEGTTFVDFEQGLNSAVNKLRQALGDSAEQARYVETVPGRGYTFIAPVQRAAAKAVLKMTESAPLRIEPTRSHDRPKTVLTAAGVALAIGVAAGYWIGQPKRQPLVLPKAVKLSVLPPRGYVLEGAASRQSFALSPDGTRLAFTAMDSSGEFSVFLRDFEALDSRQIPGSEGAHTVFWSADGQSLYMTVRGKLWRIPVDREGRVLVADAPPFMFSGASLSSNRILLDSFRASYAVSSSGGTLERLKEIYLWPNVLPGGEHAIYVKWDAAAHRYRAFVLRLGDFRTTSTLMETDSRVVYSPSTRLRGAGYLMYVRGGSLLAHPFDLRSLRITGDAIPVAGKIYSFAKTGAADFSVSASTLAYQSYISRSQLVWVDRSGREIAAIGPADINAKSARLSPDGQRLVTAIFNVERGEQDLWVLDKHANTARRLTADTALRDAPVWSPDSKALAFMAQNDGNPPGIHVRGLAEHDEEHQMPRADFQLPTDWSPDGRFIAYMNTGFPRSANEQQSDVWLLDMAHGGNLLPLLSTRFHEANAVFSPDGKWLAFTSDESGRPELYVQAFRSGDAPAVYGDRYLASGVGALAVRWRRDGRELFYLALDGRVRAVAVRLSSKPEFGRPAVLFTISSEARAAIHSILGFDVSADGNQFVIVKTPEAPSIVVVHNWQALLPH